MQGAEGRNKFYLYIFGIIVLTFFGLRAINYFTKYTTVEIGSHKFRAELAREPWEMEQGLSGRKSLGENEAMLFVFSEEGRHGFWMKDMNFPIDIIWINDGKIVYIKRNAPIPISLKPEIYEPTEPAKYVLEISAGLSEKYGFMEGDSVKLDL